MLKYSLMECQDVQFGR